MEWISNFFDGLFVFLSGGFGVVFLYLAYKLATADEHEYRLNQSRSGNWKNPWLGNLSTFHEGNRDERVYSSLTVDLKTNQWREQGRLSEESIDTVVRH